MPITKPDMTKIWASGGAVVEPSDTKKETGWTPEVPPHQWENWVQRRQDEYLAHVNERGIPQWDGLSEYLAAGLSYVQGSNGVIYKSVAASGPSTTVQDPTTDVADTYWTVAFADVGAFLTQAAGDTRYTQRANNLSDVVNVATARANLGVQNAVAAGIAGSHSNLKISAAGTNATVTITADSVCVKDSSNNQVVLNSVSVTPSLSVSGVNGLDTGTSAASIWYSVWVIWNGTVTAGLLSLSSTAPTLPSGYTHKARVGWTRSDGTANKFPLAFIQAGRSVRFKVAAGTNRTSVDILASGVSGDINAPTYVSVSLANSVPPTAFAASLLLQASSGAATMCVPSLGYGNYVSTTNPPSMVVAATTAGSGSAGFGWSVMSKIMLLESTNVYRASNGPSFLACDGWEDNL